MILFFCFFVCFVFASTPDILMFLLLLQCAHWCVLPPYGSVADMLDCSLIGLHAPETLNPVIHK